MQLTRNTPLKICLLLRDRGIAGVNARVGEYIGLPPNVAERYAAAGTVKPVTNVVYTKDVRAAGGWRKLLEKQPRLRAMAAQEETSINKQLEALAPPKSTAEQWFPEQDTDPDQEKAKK